MAQGRRVEKVAALIRREVSELILTGLRDEQIQKAMVTITEIELSGDLQHCKIFVSIFREEISKNEVLSRLQAASSFLKGELGRKLKLRRAPEIIFQLDKGIEKGSSLLNLLGKLEKERKIQDKASQKPEEQ